MKNHSPPTSCEHVANSLHKIMAALKHPYKDPNANILRDPNIKITTNSHINTSATISQQQLLNHPHSKTTNNTNISPIKNQLPSQHQRGKKKPQKDTIRIWKREGMDWESGGGMMICIGVVGSWFVFGRFLYKNLHEKHNTHRGRKPRT